MVSPALWQILALGAFAGLTIFLGMPVARAKALSPKTRAALSATAVGILLFLFVDVLSNAHALVVEALHPISGSGGVGPGAVTLAILIAGFSVGVLALLYFVTAFSRRFGSGPVGEEPSGTLTLDPMHLSTVIAVGIGFHNLSEGLAIGAAYAAGLPLAIVLVIGFAVHNSTEGFGILGPGMMAGRRYSIRRLLALGVVAGGPTFVGTVIGSLFSSAPVSVLFYGLAAGAILYVVFEMARPMLAPATRSVVVTFIVIGFVLGVLTDFIVTVGGG